MRTRHQNNPVGRDGFTLSEGKFTLNRALVVNEHAAHGVARNSSLVVPELYQPRATSENFGRKVPAVFGSHGALNSLGDCRKRATVVFKWLGTVLHVYPRP